MQSMLDSLTHVHLRQSKSTNTVLILGLTTGHTTHRYPLQLVGDLKVHLREALAHGTWKVIQVITATTLEFWSVQVDRFSQSIHYFLKPSCNNGRANIFT
jgi:hypothetical protein